MPCTGNPLRKAIAAAAENIATKVQLTTPLHVLVLGGSQGSSGLNKLILEALSEFDHDVCIWHQTGEADMALISDGYQNAQKDAQVVPFIEDMEVAYEWADVVVSRAGAMSISEIVAMGFASIFNSNPRCANNHQLDNAKLLADLGAAHYIEEAASDAKERITALFALVDSLSSCVSCLSRGGICAA